MENQDQSQEAIRSVSKDLTTWKQNSQYLYEEDKLEQSEKILKKILRIERDEHALYLLGMIEFRRFRWDHALNYFLESITRNTSNIDALYHASVALRKIGLTDKALFFLDRILDQEPDHRPSLQDKIILAYESRDYTTTENLANRLLRLDPLCRRCYRYLGFCELHRQNFPGAENFFQRAMELSPEPVEMLPALKMHINSENFLQEKQQNDTLVLEKSFIENNDHQSLGFLYFYQGKHHQAREQFELAMEKCS